MRIMLKIERWLKLPVMLPADKAAIAISIAAIFVLCAAYGQEALKNLEPGFVGSNACGACHPVQTRAWKVSQHAKAMQQASGLTVLGHFNGAEARHFNSQARFYQKDGSFFVETEGKDGKTALFEVKHTFGLSPLQQYLAGFPDGRLQALPYAWDTRPVEEGGQRWFHLYPTEDILPSDVLHWTGPQQNWNYMCAECHSTGVRKNYDAATDRFNTTFSEASVGCEACHGPASAHVRWAEGGKAADVPYRGFPSTPAKRQAINWAPDLKTGSPSASLPSAAGDAMEACDRCHSRRGQFSERWRPGQPLMDTHLPSFLTSDLFEDDGQMKDEVFNTSSFRQSKMFAKGVTCTDCHDPHSGHLKAAGSKVCSRCHSPEKFAVSSHTGHAASPSSPDCIACHMPARTYMVIDRRHDHSFRVPRPDLTVKYGVPNTCSSCHADHDAAWAAAAIERLHGPVRKGFQNYAEAFHAARLRLPESRDLLLKVAQDGSAPAIARGTALLLLRDRPSASVLEALRRGLLDEDPIVRIGALSALDAFPPQWRWALGKEALHDNVRAVRMQAASTFADMDPAGMNLADKIAFEEASNQYIAARTFNADRAEERTNLASFYARRGNAAPAEQEYLAAIKLSPAQVPPRVGLAELYRATGREAEAERLLRETISAAPNAAAAHHALGLSLIRQKRYGEALQSLQNAAELEPEQSRYAYVYAVALQSKGQEQEAKKILQRTLSSDPSNADILTILLQGSIRAANLNEALAYAEQLRVLHPDDPALPKLIGQLRMNAR
jgi:predicted CXXCH cytochrome family protein